MLFKHKNIKLNMADIEIGFNALGNKDIIPESKNAIKLSRDIFKINNNLSKKTK